MKSRPSSVHYRATFKNVFDSRIEGIHTKCPMHNVARVSSSGVGLTTKCDVLAIKSSLPSRCRSALTKVELVFSSSRCPCSSLLRRNSLVTASTLPCTCRARLMMSRSKYNSTFGSPRNAERFFTCTGRFCAKEFSQEFIVKNAPPNACLQDDISASQQCA